jgi:hypothetical protein
MNLNPTWDQEFSFLVGDIKDVLKLDVYDEDILQIDDFLGHLRVPLEDVLSADDLSLGTRWYQLLPKGKTNKTVDCGNDGHSSSFVAHFLFVICSAMHPSLFMQIHCLTFRVFIILLAT